MPVTELPLPRSLYTHGNGALGAIIWAFSLNRRALGGNGFRERFAGIRGGFSRVWVGSGLLKHRWRKTGIGLGLIYSLIGNAKDARGELDLVVDKCLYAIALLTFVIDMRNSAALKLQGLYAP